MEVRSMMDWISRLYRLRISTRYQEKPTRPGQGFFHQKTFLRRHSTGLPILWPWWKISSRLTLENLGKRKHCKKSWIRDSRTKALPCTRIHLEPLTTHLSAYPKTLKALTGWTIQSLFLRKIVRLWPPEQSIPCSRKTKRNRPRVRLWF